MLASYIEPKSGAAAGLAAASAGEAFIADCEEYITLRAEPDVESSELGTIARGSEMTLVGFDGAFAQVEYGGQRGWVLSTYIVPKNDSAVPTADFGYGDVQSGLERLASEYPGEVEVSSIGRSVEVRALGEASGYGLSDTETLDDGGYKDWAASALDIPSVTIELGYGDSPQRLAAYPTVRLRNESAPLTVADWLRQNR